jgi:hypothetical protein
MKMAEYNDVNRLNPIVCSKWMTTKCRGQRSEGFFGLDFDENLVLRSKLGGGDNYVRKFNWWLLI